MITYSPEDVIASARAADPLTRIPDWRDKIAALGLHAIAPMADWLVDPDPKLGRTAMAVLEKVSAGEHRTAAMKALRGSWEAMPVQNLPYLIGALGRLGETLPRTRRTKLRPDALVARGWMPVFHEVVDVVEKSGTLPEGLYLMDCGWAFGGKWVEDHGGLVGQAGRAICTFCAYGVGRASEGTGQRQGEPAPDNGLRTYVERNLWHTVRGQRIKAPKLGDVYLTACWRWMGAASREIIRGSLHAGLESCRTCDRNMDADEGRAPTGSPIEEQKNDEDWWTE